MACHLQIDADLDPAYHFDADPYLDPDPTFFDLMRIRIHNTSTYGTISYNEVQY
jgi:hypothetical protein